MYIAYAPFNNRIINTIVSFSIFIPTLVFSGETDALSGMVGMGAGVIDSANNLNPDGSPNRLDNLNTGADRETSVKAVILPEATWDIGEPEGMKLYFETQPPIDEVGSFAIDFGGTYDLGDSGIIDTAFFITPFEKAYKNPYETGVAREETDSLKYGFKLGLKRIMGSGFRTEFVYLKDNVDDDDIGALTPELDREGNIYSFNMNYSCYLNETLEIRPRVSLRRGDYEGKANSFLKYKVDIETRYRIGRLMIIPRISYSYSNYDEVNPLFDRTRNNNGYGARLATTYMSPFNLQNWSITGMLALSKGDSNIDFYDTEALTFGGLLNYHY